MSVAGPALLGAAAGVAFGHAVLPDHWAPLAVLGRTRKYPLSRVARLSALAGVAHVLVSIALGAVIIAVGLQFRSTVQSAEDAIVGGLLIATGLGFGLLELTGRGHHHPHAHDGAGAHGHGAEHSHPHEAPSEGQRGPDAEVVPGMGLTRVMVPFGAAASPDLTILPVFLAATAAGVTTAILSLVVFASVTIATIVCLTLLACFGGYRLHGEWLEHWGNTLTALVLVLIGALVATGAL